MWRCRALIGSLEPGFSGLLAGFSHLAAAGLIEYSESLVNPAGLVEDAPWHIRSRDYAAMKLVFDDRLLCHVDVHDSWEIDQAAYDQSHVYFKRSYDPSLLPRQDYPRLRPLGLVHDIERDGIDLRALRRIAALGLPMRERTARLRTATFASLASMLHLGPRPTESLLRASPEPSLEPKVLFMIGLWDPGAVPPDRPDKAAEFEAINEMRVACVRRLRKTFGSRFTGGVMHSEFARRRYPDTLLADPRKAWAGFGRIRGIPLPARRGHPRRSFIPATTRSHAQDKTRRPA